MFLRLFFTLLLLAVFSFAAEPSAFDAGNINLPNPYGLTNNEKVILKNKKEVKSLSTNIGFVKSDLTNIQEKIDGVRSVVESQNLRIAKIEKKIFQLQQSDANISIKIKNISSDLNTTKSIQKQNFQKIKLVLSEISSLIDSINNSYISKDDFNSKINILRNKLNQKITALEQNNLNNTLASKSGKALFKEAKKLYKNKNYSKAKIFFIQSIKKGHLPATSNFYLGEISYHNKNYSKAISYYKKSISLYGKTTTFTPTLLLHTFLSFKKLGDNKDANKFKKILIMKYPGSKEAKQSKKL